MTTAGSMEVLSLGVQRALILAFNIDPHEREAQAAPTAPLALLECQAARLCAPGTPQPRCSTIKLADALASPSIADSPKNHQSRVPTRSKYLRLIHRNRLTEMTRLRNLPRLTCAALIGRNLAMAFGYSAPAAVHLGIITPPCRRFARRAVSQPQLSRRADRRPSRICDPR